MLVQVAVRGDRHWFQVDTGADATILYGTELVEQYSLPVRQTEKLRYVRVGLAKSYSRRVSHAL